MSSLIIHITKTANALKIEIFPYSVTFHKILKNIKFQTPRENKKEKKLAKKSIKSK